MNDSLIKIRNIKDFRLTDVIKNSYRQLRVTEPITEDDWIRVSSVGNLCQREEVICSVNSVVREEVIDGDTGMNFEHGHAVHWMFQTKVLPSVGVIIGSWRCTYCGEVYGSRDTRMIQRPERCVRCGAIAGETPRVNGRPLPNINDNAFVFTEEWLGNEEHKIGGSPDGQVMATYDPNYTPDDLTLLEFKSTNEKNFEKYKIAPDFVHMIQAQLYLWLTGYRKGKIIYFNKNERGTLGIAEHDFDYDEECIERVLISISEIRTGVRDRVIPKRTVCLNDRCQRARSCAVSETCFKE